MFIREKKNKSGSVSIQILSKENGRNKLIKTIGCATERPEIESLKLKAQETLDEFFYANPPYCLLRRTNN